MAKRHEADLGSHPNLNKEPLRTGNPAETQVDRENVVVSPPTWVVDRFSAGILMLILVAILLAVGAVVIGFLFDFPFWG